MADIYSTEVLFKAIGYTIQQSDNALLEFCKNSVEGTIKTECNTANIPQELHNIASEMIVGKFLSVKKDSGQLQGFDTSMLEPIVKQISEGDTNITFDNTNTPEQRLDNLIDYLIKHGESKLVSYRRLQW